MSHPARLERSGAHSLTIRNAWVRFQFDLRTSDTMYNYVWLRRSPSEEFERRHNFGVDIHAADSRDPEKIINTVGINMPVTVIEETDEAVEIELTYPCPTLQYRQLEHAADLAAINNYPDLPHNWADSMVHADISLAVRYRITAEKPAVTVSGKVLQGTVRWFIPILNAMWVDNRQIPTHLKVEDRPPLAFDSAERPDLFKLSDIRYLLYYNPDGSGYPFAAVLHGRQTIDYPPFVNNVIGSTEFYTASTNQDFIPEQVPGEHWNDVNLDYDLRETGIAPPITWVFFPELSQRTDLTETGLADRLVSEIESNHLSHWDGIDRAPVCEAKNWS